MMFYKRYAYNSFDPNKFLKFLPAITCTEKMSTYVCTKADHSNIREVLNIDYQIFSALYFCVAPGANNQIHIDSKLNSSSFPKIALNIPLQNCTDIKMFWYESLDVNKESYMLGPSKGDKIPKLPFDNSLKLKEATINTPTFIRVDRWHNIENFNKVHCAKILSVRFLHPKYFQT